MNVLKHKLLITCILLLFIGTACSQKKEISTVASNYMKALVDYRLDDAKKFGDKSAVQFLEEQQKIINSWTPEEQEKARKDLENTEVKIINVDVKNTKAVVKYELIKDGKVFQSELLYLIKNSAGWQVQEFM